MRTVVFSLCAGLLLTGCVIVDDRLGVPVIRGGGPPPWAPAHGRRAQVGVMHSYRFYPSLGVYMNIGTGSYFYMSGGAWTVSAHLPTTLVLGTADFVTLELETDRPYMYYGDHKVKFKGKKAKLKGKKHKGWGKGPGKGRGRPF